MLDFHQLPKTPSRLVLGWNGTKVKGCPKTPAGYHSHTATEMLDLLVETSRKSGYIPDCNLLPCDVGARPHPVMIYANAVRLKVYPVTTIVKIGDTPADILEGRHAGTWLVGIAATGNMIGLSQKEFEELSVSDRDTRLVRDHAELEKGGTMLATVTRSRQSLAFHWRFADATVLRAAAAFEEAYPWAHKKPTMGEYEPVSQGNSTVCPYWTVPIWADSIPKKHCANWRRNERVAESPR